MEQQVIANEKQDTIKRNELSKTFFLKLKLLIRSETFGVFIVFLGLCAILSLISDNFLTASNIFSVARAFSYVAIMAIGMTMVIITQGIDLSVGSIFGFAGVVTAFAFAKMGLSLPISIILGLIGGVTCGFMNGILITRANLPPFIATLGMLSVARGLSYAITSGFPIQMPKSYNVIGQGTLSGVPLPVIYMLILAVVFSVLLNRTVLGRRIYALGGNEEASRISGIDVNKIKLIVYSLSGLLSAIAGLVTMARLGVAQSTAGLGYEMDVIAAVIIGGASLSGGKGTIAGTIIGAALMGVLRNGLVLLNVSAYWQQTVIGLVIITAVTLDQLRYRREKA